MAIEQLDPPYMGLNTEALPTKLPKGMVRRSVNLLPGFDGRAPVRGGMSTCCLVNATASRPTLVWTHGAATLVLRTNGNYVVLAADLSTATAVTPAAFSAPTSPAFVNTGSQVYGYANSGGGPKLMRWDGGSVSSSFNVYLSGPPNSALAPWSYQAIGYWLNRLWLLASSGPTSSVVVPGHPAPAGAVWLYYSDQFDGTLPGGAAAWQDDVSGLTNAINLDTAGFTLSPTALAPMGRSLGVFFSDAVYVLRGTGSADFSIRREVSDVGAVSSQAVASYEDGAFFVSRDGLYFYDGSELVEYSRSIRTKFSQQDYTNAQVVLLDHNYLKVVLSTDTATVWSAIMHIPSRTWTEFAGDTAVFTSGMPSYAARSPYGPLLLDDKRAWLATPVVKPTASVAAGRDVDNAGTGRPFTAESVSRVAQLATPLTSTQLRRYGVDYVHVAEDSTDPAAGWSVSLTDPTEATTYASEAVGTLADSVGTSRRRHIAQSFAEVDEVELHADFTGHATKDFRGELHDTFVEYEPSRKAASR